VSQPGAPVYARSRSRKVVDSVMLDHFLNARDGPIRHGPGIGSAVGHRGVGAAATMTLAPVRP